MAVLTRALSLVVLAVMLHVGSAPALAIGSHGGARMRVAAGRPNPGGGVTITALQAGYEFAGGGNYRLNGPSVLRPGNVWVPIRVTLHNDGGDLKAHLRVTIDPSGANNGNGGPSYRTDYTLEVDLPAGARKAATLYVRAADMGSQLTVTVEGSGQPLDSKSVSPGTQPNGSLSVGVLSDDTAASAAFHGLKEFGDTPLSVARLTNDRTPLDTQPQALDNFDLIVLSNYSSDTLTGAQLAALRSWVRGGGTLLVAGGPDAQKTMGRLPPDLLAAAYQSVTTAPDLPELTQWSGGGGTGHGTIEFSVAAPRPNATVLLSHGGVALATHRSLGRGYLVYSAIEPVGAPASTWTSDMQARFWQRLLATSLVGPADALVEDNTQGGSNASSSGSQASVTTDLGTNTSTGLPALQVYVFLIVLYVLVLGPGNYVLLRWRRRLEWSWVTVPALAALFSIGSFGLAYARNGGDVLANIDTVVYLDPGAETKLADSYIGLLAPFRGDYDLTAPGPALGWGLGGDNGVAGGSSGGSTAGLRVDEGSSFSAHLAGLQIWSQRNIGMRRQISLPGGVTGRLVLHGGNVAGEVTNTTGLTLYDCAIVGPNGASAIIHALAPGHSVSIKPFSLGNATGGGGSNPGGGPTGPLVNLYSTLGDGGARPLVGTDRYSKIVGALWPGGSIATSSAPLAFIGWSTAGLDALSVNGAAPRRSDLDLFVAPLQLTIAPGHFSLAPGDLPVSVVGTSVTSNGNSGGSLTLNSGSDHLDVQLLLPNDRRLSVETLTLQVNPAGGSSSLASDSVRVFNWRTGAYDSKDASSGSVTVTHAADYLSPDGRVLLRVRASDNGGSLSFNNVDQTIAIGAQGQVSS